MSESSNQLVGSIRLAAQKRRVQVFLLSQGVVVAAAAAGGGGVVVVVSLGLFSTSFQNLNHGEDLDDDQYLVLMMFSKFLKWV